MFAALLLNIAGRVTPAVSRKSCDRTGTLQEGGSMAHLNTAVPCSESMPVFPVATSSFIPVSLPVYSTAVMVLSIRVCRVCVARHLTP